MKEVGLTYGWDVIWFFGNFYDRWTKCL